MHSQRHKPEQITFHNAREGFLRSADTPRDYLERCLARLERDEPIVRAWAATRIEGARADADRSTERYRAGKPLSPIDGMPVGIKDLISTKDLPTGLGITGNENRQTGEDSPSVRALRGAGAVVVGKTVTTELGGGWPSVTTNPFDSARSPGGSSSGSAAAVAAGMVPAALGTQVGGSILRPAAYCGNYAIKPTMGAIHRGERLSLSHACIGTHAASIEDMWLLLSTVATRSGGDPGYPGLFGEEEVPSAQPIKRLAFLREPGWSQTDSNMKDLFGLFLESLEQAGIETIDASRDPEITALEDGMQAAFRIVGTVVAFENRPTLAQLMETMPDKLSPATRQMHEGGIALTLTDYRRALDDRDNLRRLHTSLAKRYDAILSPTTTGLPPLIAAPENPAMATGNPIYNVVPSLLGAPAITLPLLMLDGMPAGVQIMGGWHTDQQLTGQARWLTASIAPITSA